MHGAILNGDKKVKTHTGTTSSTSDASINDRCSSFSPATAGG
jgi:hypothetical protein